MKFTKAVEDRVVHIDKKISSVGSLVISAYSEQVVDDTARHVIYTGRTPSKKTVTQLEDLINRICEKIDRLNQDAPTEAKVYVDAREVLDSSKHLIKSPLDIVRILEGDQIESNKHNSDLIRITEHK